MFKTTINFGDYHIQNIPKYAPQGPPEVGDEFIYQQVLPFL